VGPGQGLAQPLLRDEAELVEVRAEAAAVEDLVLDGLLELSLGDDATVAQDASENRQWVAPGKGALL
jgi:hypothetical protein